jgi:hypothetical protein
MTTINLGPDAGRVLIKTGRAGLAARAGHDLTLEVTRWSARVELPADAAGDAGGATAVAAELDLGSLEVREGTGGVMPRTDSDRAQIKKTMSGILGVATAAFTSSRIVRAAGGGEIEGTVTLRGKAQPVRLQIAEPAPGRYRGTATLRQTAFGIKPYSGFFGTLKLSDEVRVEFDLNLAHPDPAAT